jgi:hypothetical protein
MCSEHILSAYLLANRADVGFMSTCRAVFTTKENNLKVELVPKFLRKQAFGIFLGLNYIFS